MRPRPSTPEAAIARLATRAHGVVTRAQLARAGVTSAQVSRRLRAGALLPVHRGVYRVGHRAPSVEATYLAAVLACGPGALLAGSAAGHLLALRKGPPPAPQVVAPRERRPSGIRCRRCRGLVEADRIVWRGVPTTSVPRTLVDLAAELGEEMLARACHEAGVRYGTTPAHVRAVLARRPNSPGARTLRDVCDGTARVTLSTLERRFLALLRAERLPLPVANRPAGARRVDCRWPARRLTVELDSYRFHNSRHAWEEDRAREREARSRGDEFRRYTYADVCEDARYMLADLRALLAVPAA